MSSVGSERRWRRLVLVESITSSPMVCERRTSRMPSFQRMSGVEPARRRGRSDDGRKPVANPSAVIAKCCGNRRRISARNVGTSAGVNEFGSSSVYALCVEVSNGRTPEREREV